MNSSLSPWMYLTWYRLLMASYAVNSPSWNDNVSPKYFRMIVPTGYRETGFNHVERLFVSLLTGLLGVQLGFNVGIVGGLVAMSLPRMDWSVLIAVASSHWLLKTGDGVGGAFRTANRSIMIKDNRSVPVIIGSAHVVGKKSIVFNTRSFFDLLMKHR